MANGTAIQCQGRGGLMKVQMERLDLGSPGDGLRARDDDFAGILAEVYSCGACGRVAIRPVQLEFVRVRATAA